MCAISFFFIEFSLRPFQCSVYFYCGLFRVGEGGRGYFDHGCSLMLLFQGHDACQNVTLTGPIILFSTFVIFAGMIDLASSPLPLLNPDDFV